MRSMRDKLADTQQQNRAIEFILKKEETLSEHKAESEQQAL